MAQVNWSSPSSSHSHTIAAGANTNVYMAAPSPPSLPSCSLCGAAVMSEAQDTHRRWHQKVERLLRMMNQPETQKKVLDSLRSDLRDLLDGLN